MRLRRSTNLSNRSKRLRPSNRLGRCKNPSPLRRSFHHRRRRRSASRLNFPPTHATDRRAKRISSKQRHPGAPKPMIIPCIDLQNGKAVQLVQGRRRALAVKDVLGLLQRFQKYSQLHIIDLDAALHAGRNNHLVRKLCREAKHRFGFRIRVGGGIRTTSRALNLLRAGADQVILGSAVFQNGKIRKQFLANFARKVGRKRIIIALDTKKGRIVISGWRQKLQARPEDVIPQLEPYCAGLPLHLRRQRRHSPRHKSQMVPQTPPHHPKTNHRRRRHPQPKRSPRPRANKNGRRSRHGPLPQSPKLKP